MSVATRAYTRFMRRWGLVVAAVVALATGCRFDSSGPLWLEDAGVPPPDAPVVDDVDATLEVIDAAPPPDTAWPEPDAGPNCTDGTCPLGCNLTLDRCNRLDPINFDVDGFYDDLTAGLTVGAGEDVRVDTDSGEIASDTTTYRPAGNQGEVVSGIYFGLVVQPDAPVLAVFGMTSLALPEGSQIIVVGSHPAAFFTIGDISLAGDVDAWGWYDAPGPGGGAGGTDNGADGASCHGGQGRGGDQAGDYGDQIEAGGGGGGLTAAGGKGADASYEGNTTPGGAGGVLVALAATPFSPLRAGCGGGAGGGPDTYGSEPNHGGWGGGGGGGVQFSAQGNLNLAATGVIDVGGGQGQGGLHGAGGGGGGSGGVVLLEAATVSINGMVVANGGGAGAGAGDTGSDGADGEAAHQSSDPALGGIGENWGGNGGNGGAGATYGGSDGVVDANGGGGGGAVGAIGIRYQTGLSTAGTLSPDNYSKQAELDVW